MAWRSSDVRNLLKGNIYNAVWLGHYCSDDFTIYRIANYCPDDLMDIIFDHLQSGYRLQFINLED